MNDKLCKALRKTVRNAVKDSPEIKDREYQTISRSSVGRNEPKGFQLVNSPKSKRGLYRYLKKQTKKLGSTVLK